VKLRDRLTIHIAVVERRVRCTAVHHTGAPAKRRGGAHPEWCFAWASEAGRGVSPKERFALGTGVPRAKPLLIFEPHGPQRHELVRAPPSA
jgi:hypothetical protein